MAIVSVYQVSIFRYGCFHDPGTLGLYPNIRPHFNVTGVGSTRIHFVHWCMYITIVWAQRARNDTESFDISILNEITKRNWRLSDIEVPDVFETIRM